MNKHCAKFVIFFIQSLTQRKNVGESKPDERYVTTKEKKHRDGECQTTHNLCDIFVT